MPKQEVIAIVGSKVFRDLEQIRFEIRELKPGSKVLTGDLGVTNQEVQRLVRERGDLFLEIISSSEHGEDQANLLTLQQCDRAVIFRGSTGKAVNLTMLARHLKKPFKTIDDVAVHVS